MKVKKVVYDSILYVNVQCGQKRIKYSTGVKIKKENFNPLTGTIRKNFPNHDVVQLSVDDFFNSIKRSIALVEMNELELTRENIDRFLISNDSVESIPLLPDFLNYAKNKRTIKESTRKRYMNTYNNLKNFERYARMKLTNTNFNREQFDKFMLYCHSVLQHNDNTLNKSASIIKAYFRAKYPDGNWSFINFKPFTPNVIYLFKEEFDYVKGASVPNDTLSRVRDLFVFSCVTGMSFSDSQKFKLGSVHNDVITYFRKKTNSMAMLPLSNIAQNICIKYGGRPPQFNLAQFNYYLKALFRFLDMDREVQVTTKYFNKNYIMEYPLYDVVSSHLARKTFVMLLLSKKVPIQDIMHMTGHKEYNGIKPYINMHREHLRSYVGIF